LYGGERFLRRRGRSKRSGLRSGHIVAEGWWAPYSPDRSHRLHSLSKSFTATAISLLASEGQLSVDDHLVALFPEALPATVDDHLAAMRVRDLLTIRTEHAEDVMGTLVEAEDGGPAFLPKSSHRLPYLHFLSVCHAR